MEKHFLLSDDEFEHQFDQCLLDPDIFSHEAHLRLAWIKIRKLGLENAEIEVQSSIKKYVENLGATDKYHTTLTVAAVKIMGHFMNRSNSEDFRDLIMEFPRLKKNFKQLIESHYSKDIFSSTEAKSQYMEPDILPFED